MLVKMLIVKTVLILTSGHFNQHAFQPISGNVKSPEVIDENYPWCNIDLS